MFNKARQYKCRMKTGVSGASDLSIYFRQSVYISVPHELEFTLSPFVVVPIGDRQIADQGFTHLGGELLIGKGMEDLPDGETLNTCVLWRYRPRLAMQAESRGLRIATFSPTSNSNTRLDTSIASSSPLASTAHA